MRKQAEKVRLVDDDSVGGRMVDRYSGGRVVNGGRVGRRNRVSVLDGEEVLPI